MVEISQKYTNFNVKKICEIFSISVAFSEYLNFINGDFTRDPNALYKIVVVFNLSIVLRIFKILLCQKSIGLDFTFILKGDDFSNFKYRGSPPYAHFGTLKKPC